MKNYANTMYISSEFIILYDAMNLAEGFYPVSTVDL